jgi:hypothetical protein
MSAGVVTTSRGRCLAVLGVLTPIGFLTKFYSGPGSSWVASQAGGFLYVVFWIFAALFAFPRLSRRTASLAVLGATCVLEFAQLWHPPWLEPVRSTFLGAALLGATFAWLDFPYYAAGAFAGHAAARALGCGSPTARVGAPTS